MPGSTVGFVARAEPVCSPGLSALALTSHTTPHQMSRILKPGDPASIPVESAECDVGPAVGRICIASFDAEIQSRNLWQPGNVYSCEPSRNIGANKRSNFVMFGKAFSVESHSVQQSGNPITEIQTGAARSWFVRVARERVTGREYTSQERMQGQGIAGSSVICGA